MHSDRVCRTLTLELRAPSQVLASSKPARVLPGQATTRRPGARRHALLAAGGDNAFGQPFYIRVLDAEMKDTTFPVLEVVVWQLGVSELEDLYAGTVACGEMGNTEGAPAEAFFSFRGSLDQVAMDPGRNVGRLDTLLVVEGTRLGPGHAYARGEYRMVLEKIVVRLGAQGVIEAGYAPCFPTERASQHTFELVCEFAVADRISRDKHGFVHEARLVEQDRCR